MPIFISYSHADAEFVNKLAAHLVKSNAHVWVDTWELNVGDSILNRVQQAIQDSSALLIVLSKASVASEWCKKELSAGLMRELEEKRVVVLPVLIENCDIPIFLREKLYADFRANFDVGLNALLSAVARIINIDQGRIAAGKGHIDWGETWGYEGELFCMDFTLVESSPDLPFTLLTQISLTCNDVLTRRYEEYKKQGLNWLGRVVITEMLADFAEAEDIRLILKDQFPQSANHFVDSARKANFKVIITCRRMGEDNGKNQLVGISNYFRQIREQTRKTARKPTSEELARVTQLLSRQ